MIFWQQRLIWGTCFLTKTFFSQQSFVAGWKVQARQSLSTPAVHNAMQWSNPSTHICIGFCIFVCNCICICLFPLYFYWHLHRERRSSWDIAFGWKMKGSHITTLTSVPFKLCNLSLMNSSNSIGWIFNDHWMIMLLDLLLFEIF